MCELLARRLKPSIQIVSITLDNKRKLLPDCGEATSQLFKDGCERVVIVWDLYPPWREAGAKPCRREDRQTIARSLKKAKVSSKHVYLVCIEQELEAWLITDGRAISQVLSRPAHPVRVADVKSSDKVNNPKKRIMKTFLQHTGRPYTDRIHAKQIIEVMPDLNRIKRCASFIRFAAKATGVAL
ncbi:MAG: DUF4276 family protein [Nitrospira sp.]|nr:DUF4276 family protein [Nitrospira sp.]